VEVWDSRTGEPVRSFVGAPAMHGVGFSPSGTFLVAVLTRDLVPEPGGSSPASAVAERTGYPPPKLVN